MERHRFQYFNLLRATHCTLLAKPGWLLAAIMLLFPSMAYAACDENVSYSDGNSNFILLSAQCSTQAEAQQACYTFAAARGYGSNFGGCHIANSEAVVTAGWLQEYQDVQSTPLYLISYYYGLEPRSNPPKNAGKPQCPDSCIGNPINAGIGNKVESKIEFQGEGSFPLSLSWTYNSQDSPLYISSASKGFGRKRMHSYSAKIAFFASTTVPLAYALRPDGKAERFRWSSAGWLADSDSGARLTSTTDTSGAVVSWEYEDEQGRKELYAGDGRLLSLHTVSGMAQTLSYDAGEKLLSVQDSNGRSIEFEYDASNRISKVKLPDGNSNHFTYSASHDLIRTEYPDGRSMEYLYDELDHVSAYTNPGALTGSIDESLERYLSVTYDDNTRATSTTHAGGLDSFSATYQTATNGTYFSQATVNLPNGASREINFDAVQGVVMPTSVSTSCTGCVSSNTTYTYDSNGNADLIIRNGVITDVDYGTRALETQRINSANDNTGRKRTTQTDWHATFPVPTERRIYDTSNALASKSTWTYNTRGQALTASQINPTTSVARTTTTTYCESSDVTADTCPLVGLVTSVNGPRTDVTDTTSYTYRMADEASCATTPTTCPYRKGDLWKVTNALGQITETLAYDGAGRVLSVKDANGVITDLEYHPRGWLTARKTRGANNAVETDDAITRIEYWPTGLVKKVIQPDGAFTSYIYDAAHRLTDIADNAGNTIHYTLDNAGNRTQEDTRDPANVLKRTLSRVFNQLGQLQTQADAQANPTDFTFDANGNTNTVTDALGRVTDNDYDPLGRLSRTLQDVGGINAETQFAYDAQDNLTQVTDPKGLSTTYIYNGLGDLTQLSSPDTGITSYTYDSAGNRATQTDARNQTSIYSYDALNRLTGIAYATPSLNVAYTYDSTQPPCSTGETFSAGRLTGLADASGTTQYCYDRFGNLVRKVQTTNGVALTVRYAYTLAGQLSSVIYPDGATASYVRDAQGRTTQVNVQRASAASEVLLNQASYYPFGPVAGWTYGNGRQLQRPLNQNYQPTAIHDAGTGGLSVGFQYDPVGNLTQLTPVASTTPLVKFDYDTLSRLTAFKDGPTNVAIESYAYDATGNRQSFTNAAGIQAYTYPSTSHRLSQVGATARTYDNAGNTTAIGGLAKEFVYDDTGRMSQVKQNAIVQMNYAYNGKGEQVRKHQGTANTYTVYDEAGHWLGDYDNTGTALQQAIWLDDLPVGLIANGNQLHYIEPDHLGTPRVVIEVARNVPVWNWDLKSEAFGNGVQDQDPDGDSNPLVFDMRFPGQRHDAASGLNQNYFREYESGTGRYSQSDPIGHAGGIATYVYVGSSPLRFSDALGLEDVWDTKTCAGALGLTTCDGKDGFIANNCNEGCDRTCTQMHEEDHVRIIKSRFPNACVGRPLGAAPYPINWTADTPEYRALIHELECRADTITANCIRKLKRQGKSDGPAEKHLLEAIKRRKERKCDLYGY